MMDATIETTKDGKKTLVIKVALTTPKPSSSGETMLIASENQKAAVQYEGHDVTIGLNAYFKPEGKGGK